MTPLLCYPIANIAIERGKLPAVEFRHQNSHESDHCEQLLLVDVLQQIAARGVHDPADAFEARQSALLQCDRLRSAVLARSAALDEALLLQRVQHPRKGGTLDA